MFKNLLIDWVTELNEKIATAGDSGYLTIIYLSLQTIQMLIPISVFWFTTSETWANSSALLGWLW